MSDSWNSGKHKATILAKDKLQYNENLFIHNNGNLGRYARAGYWLEAIMNELGYGSNDYIYDTDMDNIVMDLSLVHTIPAKEVLQQLANYCCKTLYIDNEGKLVISSATNITNETVEYTEDINVTSASYSEQITGTLSTTYDRVMARVVISGVRAYTDSVDVSGSDYSYDFVPRYGVGKYQVSIVGLKDGDTPDFEITSNDILDDIEITKEELIKEVIVPFYTPYYVEYDGELQIADEQITVSELPYNYVKLLGDTIYTGLYIEITDSTPLISQSDLTQQTSTRLRGGTTDISIDQQYLFEIEAGFKIKQIIEQNSSTATLNTINVNNTYYYYAPTRNDVAMITVYIENDSGTAISPSDVGDFRMARIEYMENTDAPTDCITLSFANTGSFRVYIEAYGYYQFNKTNVKYQINSTGKSLTWDNPLVGSQERALLIAEFVGNYLQSNISYNYKYRGNPELNANDIIKQENDFVSNMQVVVGEHKIGFNGALSGEITARRRLTE